VDGLDDAVFGPHGGGEMKIAVMAGLSTKWNMNINTGHEYFSSYTLKYSARYNNPRPTVTRDCLYIILQLPKMMVYY
jgi:hypothetical protein